MADSLASIGESLYLFTGYLTWSQFQRHSDCSLHNNEYIVVGGRPCKIVDITTAIGLGQAKVHLVGIDIFAGKRLEDTVFSTHNMDVPLVNRNEFSLVNIDDSFLSLASGDGNE